MVSSDFNSKKYWEERYKNSGNSGSGSYGDEANFKSTYINKFILDYKIKSINDFGCGDSNQISMLNNFEKYTGFDISNTILNLCINKFKLDDRFNFVDNVNNMSLSDVTFSLDVTYHVIEDEYFNEYMHNLFKLTNKYVLIYSINSDDSSGFAEHLKNRKFVDWVSINYPNFELIDNKPFTNKDNGVGFYLFRMK